MICDEMFHFLKPNSEIDRMAQYGKNYKNYVKNIFKFNGIYHMLPIKATPSYPIRRFWDQYIQYLADKGAKPSVVRWYVIRVEHYIRHFEDKRLATRGAGDVEQYLPIRGKKCRNHGLAIPPGHRWYTEFIHPVERGAAE